MRAAISTEPLIWVPSQRIDIGADGLHAGVASPGTEGKMLRVEGEFYALDECCWNDPTTVVDDLVAANVARRPPYDPTTTKRGPPRVLARHYNVLSGFFSRQASCHAWLWFIESQHAPKTETQYMSK